MKGSFSEESLTRFAELAAQALPADFAEGGTYDFTRCVRPDGSSYGTGGKCRQGTEGEAKIKTPTTQRKPKEVSAAKSSRDALKKGVRSLGMDPSKIKAEEWRMLEDSIKKGYMSREEAIYEIALVADKRKPRKESRSAGPNGNFAP